MRQTHFVTSGLRRNPGRPYAGPRTRLVLTCPPADAEELRRLAHAEPLASFLLAAARFFVDHRPKPRAERRISTIYTWARLEGATGPIMQVRRDTYGDGRSVDIYTGIEYADTAAATAECLMLNLTPRRDGPRATPAPGGALTPQDGG